MPADKGRTTVILNKTEYDDKISQIIDDSESYSTIRNDPTSSIETKLRNLLKEWKNKNFITENQYKHLLILNGRLPSFFALPKIHKPQVPLRPIVSFCGSPLHALTKFLKTLLQPLVKDNYSVKNSYEFSNFIRDQTIDVNETMVSFDVVNLFPSIPQSLAISTLEEILFSANQQIFSSEHAELIIKGVKLCLNSSYFLAQNLIKKQIKGVPMGSSLSPIIAELVMNKIENIAINSFTNYIKIWKRFVDDTFVVLNKNFIESFHEHLNNINGEIKFTIEIETNQKLSFLDVLVVRKIDGTLDTEVFHKLTHTGQYLNYFSSQPVSHKAAVVKTLMHRAKNIPSTHQGKIKEISRVKNTLIKNHYPKYFINKHSRTQTANLHPDDHNRKITLPYIKNFSEKIRRIFKPYEIDINFKPESTLKTHLVKLKDIVPKNKQNNLIYETPCSNCEIKYIGETMQRLENRLKQHKYAVEKGNVQHSALTEHCLNNMHAIDWENTKIIKKNLVCFKRRKFLEAIKIQNSSDICNRDRGVPIPEIYNSILE